MGWPYWLVLTTPFVASALVLAAAYIAVKKADRQ